MAVCELICKATVDSCTPFSVQAFQQVRAFFLSESSLCANRAGSRRKNPRKKKKRKEKGIAASSRFMRKGHEATNLYKYSVIREEGTMKHSSSRTGSPLAGTVDQAELATYNDTMKTKREHMHMPKTRKLRGENDEGRCRGTTDASEKAMCIKSLCASSKVVYADKPPSTGRTAPCRIK